jgi:hypothetical protein
VNISLRIANQNCRIDFEKSPIGLLYRIFYFLDGQMIPQEPVQAPIVAALEGIAARLPRVL